jgi:putative FmdB family regulatory protein
MPVYEYTCPSCKAGFELLRPITKMNDRAACPECATDADRKLSVFSAMIMGSDGAMLPMAGGGGGCGCGGNCACAM